MTDAPPPAVRGPKAWKQDPAASGSIPETFLQAGSVHRQHAHRRIGKQIVDVPTNVLGPRKVTTDSLLQIPSAATGIDVDARWKVKKPQGSHAKSDGFSYLDPQLISQIIHFRGIFNDCLTPRGPIPGFRQSWMRRRSSLGLIRSIFTRTISPRWRAFFSGSGTLASMRKSGSST